MTYTRETERRTEVVLEGKLKHRFKEGKQTQSRQDPRQGLLSRQAQFWTLA